MGVVRRKFNREFKLETMRMIAEQGLTIAQASRDLGINDKVLHRWKNELAEHGTKAFPGNGVPVEQELARLRQENMVLRREREILKKATIFFAQHAPEG